MRKQVLLAALILLGVLVQPDLVVLLADAADWVWSDAHFATEWSGMARFH